VFTADGKRLLVGSFEPKVWTISDSSLVCKFKKDANSYASWSAFSASSNLAVSSDMMELARPSATLWDTRTGRSVQQFHGDSAWVYFAQFTPDGRGLLLDDVRVGRAEIWDLASGRVSTRFAGHQGRIRAAAFSPRGDRLLTGSFDRTAKLWDIATGKEFLTLIGHADTVSAVAFSAEGERLLTGSWDASIRVWDSATGQQLHRLGDWVDDDHPPKRVGMPNLSPDLKLDSGDIMNRVGSAVFSADGMRVLSSTWDPSKSARIWEVQTGKELVAFKGHCDTVVSAVFSPDERQVLTSSGDGTARIWDVGSVREIRRFVGHRGGLPSARFSPDGTQVLTCGVDGTARLWRTESGEPIRTYSGHVHTVNSALFSPDGCRIVTAGSDGGIRLWETQTGVELCRLIRFQDGGWILATPDGRFDTDNLDEIPRVQWVIPDDPFRPLPPEIFVRDFYEPRLLPRVLLGEGLRPLRQLAELNRVQPAVRVVGVEAGGPPEAALVTVEVAAAEGRFGREDEGRLQRTAVYDLRLFRDRQLVGRWPEPADDAEPEPDPTRPEQMAAWRDANRVPLVGGKATRTFTVRLPHRPGSRVEFTAYAFNEDRVKSTTAPAAYEVPKGVPAAKPRAYLVAFGAAGFSDPDWDLSFAAADARLAAGELGRALEAAKQYEVVPVVLATDRGAAGRPPRRGEAAATAAHLKAVLDRLAGRPVDPARAGVIAGLERLQPATPDDLVLLFASSHGYTDHRGAYYMFPQDLGKPRGLGRRVVTPDLLEACVSSGELSAWLRKVDAGQLALIVDCCHAAATVEQPGFKPGPMGSRGLGQLAYDKGMRVLAASAADDVALEALVEGEGHGLLTHALVREGLLEKKAAGAGGGLTLGGLLKYAEGRVPGLYAEVVAAEAGKGALPGGARVLAARGAELEPLGDAGAPEGSSLRKKGAFQTPAFFDYARGRDAALDKRRGER